MTEMRATYYAALFLLLASTASPAQQIPAPVRASADAIRAEQIARDLGFFASDALRGRNSLSAEFDSASAYIAKRLAAAGLKPLGDGGSFFQHFNVVQRTADTAATYLEAGGRRVRFGDELILNAFADPVTITAPAVYVGHGWRIPDRNIDAFGGVEVRGKIVIVHGPRALPKGVEIPRLGRINVGAIPVVEEARRRGAVAVIMIAQNSVVTQWDQQRRSGLGGYELESRVPSAYAAAPITAVMVKPEVAEALFSGEPIAGRDIVTRGESADYPPSFQLAKTVTLNVPAAVNITHRGRNVVALLEGSDPALRQEYITIESHLDGAVGTRVVNGDSIYNAADDNASGSAGNLSIAEQVAKAPHPKRSLIFIWDSGEERGLWGTRHFVANPPVPFERIVAHFNIDMIGANRVTGSADSADARVTGPDEVYLVGPGMLSAEADSLLQRVNRSYLNLRYNRSFDRADHEFFYPRTDAGPFLERGVLTIGYFTGLHGRYHAPSDEARYLDAGKIERISRTILVSAWMLANADTRPRIDKAIPAAVPRYR
jgi:hypothetical protein